MDGSAGLAATVSGNLNTYGDGSNNTVTHYYAGKKKKKKKTSKKKGK